MSIEQPICLLWKTGGGICEMLFNTAGLALGVLFCRLQTRGLVQARTLPLVQ